METTTIGPITVETGPAAVRFRFTHPDMMTLEIPVSLEGELSAFLDQRLQDVRGKRFVIDLENLPAVSSRQLGMMLTIRKLCEPIGSLELESVSEPVRYLLKMTRMSGYFNLAESKGD